MASISSPIKVAPAPVTTPGSPTSPARTSPVKQSLSPALNVITGIPENRSVADTTRNQNRAAAKKTTLIRVKAAKGKKHTPGNSSEKPLQTLDVMMAADKFILESPEMRQLLKGMPSLRLVYEKDFVDAVKIVQAEAAQEEAARLEREEAKKRQDEAIAMQQAWTRRIQAYSMLPKLAQGFIATMRKEFINLETPTTEPWKQEVIRKYRIASTEDLMVVNKILSPLVEHPYLVTVLPDSLVERIMLVSERERIVNSVTLGERLSMHSGSRHSHFSSPESFRDYRKELRRESKIAGRAAFHVLENSPAILMFSLKVNEALRESLTPRLVVDFPDNQNNQTRVFNCLFSNVVQYVYYPAEEGFENPMRNGTLSEAFDAYVRGTQAQILSSAARAMRL